MAVRYFTFKMTSKTGDRVAALENACASPMTVDFREDMSECSQCEPVDIVLQRCEELPRDNSFMPICGDPEIALDAIAKLRRCDATLDGRTVDFERMRMSKLEDRLHCYEDSWRSENDHPLTQPARHLDLGVDRVIEPRKSCKPPPAKKPRAEHRTEDLPKPDLPEAAREVRFMARPKENKRLPRHRNWCFTAFFADLNADEHSSILHFLGDAERVPECYVGIEECPKTKRGHWQGYLELSTSCTMAQVKHKMGCDKVHLEPAKGSRASNWDYCMKGIPFYYRFGSY